MTIATADLRPSIELPCHSPRAALFFDDARELQTGTRETLTLFLEKRTPAKTHQYRHDEHSFVRAQQMCVLKKAVGLAGPPPRFATASYAEAKRRRVCGG